MTDVSPDDMLERLDDVLAGNFAEDRRSPLERAPEHEGASVATLTALNDVVAAEVGNRPDARFRDLDRRPVREYTWRRMA